MRVVEGFGKEKKKQECDKGEKKRKASQAPGTEIRSDCEGHGDWQTGPSEALGPSSLHPWTRTRFSRGLRNSVFSGGQGWREKSYVSRLPGDYPGQGPQMPLGASLKCGRPCSPHSS